MSVPAIGVMCDALYSVRPKELVPAAALYAHSMARSGVTPKRKDFKQIICALDPQGRPPPNHSQSGSDARANALRESSQTRAGGNNGKGERSTKATSPSTGSRPPAPLVPRAHDRREA